MAVKTSPLVRAFIADHRAFTRELVALKSALEARDWRAARRLADEVDRLAGPHIAFEEEELYPVLARILGDAFAAELYDEHATGCSLIHALHDLVNCPDERAAAELARRAGTMLDHTVRCGSLLSYLNVLDEAEHARLLERLETHRARGVRWSDRPTSHPLPPLPLTPES
jgi:hypothetical protein